MRKSSRAAAGLTSPRRLPSRSSASSHRQIRASAPTHDGGDVERSGAVEWHPGAGSRAGTDPSFLSVLEHGCAVLGQVIGGRRHCDRHCSSIELLRGHVLRQPHEHRPAVGGQVRAGHAFYAQVRRVSDEVDGTCSVDIDEVDVCRRRARSALIWPVAARDQNGRTCRYPHRCPTASAGHNLQTSVVGEWLHCTVERQATRAAVR